MEKKVALTIMKEKMENLRKAWQDCWTAFDLDYAIPKDVFDCNDYIVEHYPFTQSFDEININEWVDSTIELIDKELKELDKPLKIALESCECLKVYLSPSKEVLKFYWAENVVYQIEKYKNTKSYLLSILSKDKNGFEEIIFNCLIDDYELTCI